ncbi:DNA polymerase [Selenomonas artemidis]|uniref:DNA-directed DNA polymerase n=1 Tax=Selenomonas artemidis F0399 TaxID=749551 RepID=E7N418_9FIRM|nr:DNA polymerase [Selenomonas artemidis]EFW29059.1 putative DNA-directed DNA polymerase [Selenomonas artemidis F0399]
MILSIDLETYSALDIKTVGGYRYAENAEILLFAYAWDDTPVQIVDLTAEETIPADVLSALTDNDIMKCAFNAQFERTVLSHYLHKEGEPFAFLDPAGWSCTMVHALTLGLPGSLAEVSKTLKLGEEKEKMSVGTQLITYFCKPCKPTKSNGGRTRNLPNDAPEKWATFKAYCVRDVEAEREVRRRLSGYPVPETERALWALDQRINDRGVRIDEILAQNAIAFDSAFRAEVTAEASALSGLENPNSGEQLKHWIYEQEGARPLSLTKETIPELIETAKSETVKTMLQLKMLLSKTSVKKYEAMVQAQCSDGRAHGLLQFYGANRTGRWAGRLVQVQNLPRNTMAELDDARALLRCGDTDALEMLFDNPPDVLSQLIRTAFIPAVGMRFTVADFSAIEARVIAWLAGEKWRMDVFADGGDIYCASASKMFHVPVEKHGVNGHLRQKGKVAELALGYGGGVSALKRMGADKLGLTDAELEEIKQSWRKASPRIVRLWSDFESAALEAVRERSTVSLQHGIKLECRSGILFIRLPSGRSLAYVKPRIEYEESFDREGLTYYGRDVGGWGKQRTYGGRLVENAIQAIARDCLAVAMTRLEAAGYPIVMHIHDEVVVETPRSVDCLADVCEIMSKPVDWAPGLVLTADGYTTNYYKKD